MRAVSVTTGSRLHFGPLSVAGPAGGRFGGVGVMIASPRTVLTAKQAATDSIVGDASAIVRVAEFLKRIRNTAPEEFRVPCEISISETIPSHCGYGSGTQLCWRWLVPFLSWQTNLNPDWKLWLIECSEGCDRRLDSTDFSRGDFSSMGDESNPMDLARSFRVWNFPQTGDLF